MEKSNIIFVTNANLGETPIFRFDQWRLVIKYLGHLHTWLQLLLIFVTTMF